MRLVPKTERVRVLGFSLAQTCHRFPGVNLLAVCQMSNHLHLVLRDGSAQLSSFMQYFLGNLARRMNRIDRLHGPLFERRFSEIEIVDEVALIDRIAYAIANPVEANLVRSHREWTGLCVFARSNAARVAFTYFHEGRYRRALARAEGGPEDPTVRRADFQETATLEVGTLDAELAERVETAVKAREAQIRATQRGVVGMSTVEAMEPLAQPEASSRSPMPLCFASTSEAWSGFVAGWRAFRHAFHAASYDFRHGVLDVVFPAGSFRPPCWAG